MFNRARHNQAGAAHLVLVAVIALVIIGALGFVGYNAWQRSEANAGGIITIGGSRATNNQSQKIPAVTATFKPSDWTKSKNAKVVKDARYGSILRINKVGLDADKAILASVPATDGRFKQLNVFNYAVSQLGMGTTYTAWTCVAYQRTYTNQDIGKFPFVSTFVTDVAGYRIGGSVYDTTWHAKECKSSKVNPQANVSIQELIKARREGTLAKLYERYKGFTITTKTTLPDNKKANPAANGTINIGDVTVVVTLDSRYRP